MLPSPLLLSLMAGQAPVRYRIHNLATTQPQQGQPRSLGETVGSAQLCSNHCMLNWGHLLGISAMRGITALLLGACSILMTACNGSFTAVTSTFSNHFLALTSACFADATAGRVGARAGGHCHGV